MRISKKEKLSTIKEDLIRIDNGMCSIDDLLDRIYLLEIGTDLNILDKIIMVENQKGLFGIEFKDIPKRDEVNGLYRIFKDDVFSYGGDENKLYYFIVDGIKYDIFNSNNTNRRIAEINNEFEILMNNKCFNIGRKYKSKTMEWIAENDIEYCKWLSENYQSSNDKNVSRVDLLIEMCNDKNNISINPTGVTIDNTDTENNIWEDLYDGDYMLDSDGDIYLSDGVYVRRDGSMVCKE